MRVLIVDDETLARAILSEHLAKVSGVEVVGQAANGFEAVKLAEELTPDLMFLDIQMPKLSGFEVLELLGDRAPAVVFTTAFDEFALRAFEVHAVDYLLKPVESERLAAALRKLQSSAGPPGPASPGAPLEQLFVRDGPRCWFVPLREVSVISSEGNYVRLLWGRERPLLGRSLAALETKLDPKRFFRANRRQLINLDHIEQVELGEGGRLHVTLRDGPEIEISRRQARLFRARTGA